MHKNIENNDYLARFKDVLTAEIEGLSILRNNMPKHLVEAVKLILSCKGKVIISGVGKSGIIGKKIAATLSSTGTPSYFLHATEASHGDAGLLTIDDILLCISNSGNTAEIKPLVEYAKSISIPLIAISSNMESELMGAADFMINIPAAPEACPLGLAPTTSCVTTLAVGDALAVLLMYARDFTKPEFHKFHPAGTLGAKLMSAGEIMHPIDELCIVEETTPMLELVVSMSRTGFGVGIICDKDMKVTGVISDGDIRRNLSKISNLTAGEIATRSPVKVEVTDLTEAVIEKMESYKTYNILVVECSRLVGLVRMHDILKSRKS